VQLLISRALLIQLRLLRSLGGAILAGAAAALLPALLLFYASVFVGSVLDGPEPAPPQPPESNMVQNFLVFSPIIETTVLSLFLLSAHRFIPRPLPVSILAGLIAAYLHFDTQGPYSLLPVAWQFFVYSYLFLQWWKHSYWQAWLAAAAPHFLLNLGVLGLNALLLLLYPPA
jgi:hypothetical protein